MPTVPVVVDNWEVVVVPEALAPDGRWKRVKRGLGLPTLMVVVGSAESVTVVVPEALEPEGRWKRVKRGLGLPTLVVVVVGSADIETVVVSEALETEGRRDLEEKREW